MRKAMVEDKGAAGQLKRTLAAHRVALAGHRCTVAVHLSDVAAHLGALVRTSLSSMRACRLCSWRRLSWRRRVVLDIETVLRMLRGPISGYRYRRPLSFSSRVNSGAHFGCPNPSDLVNADAFSFSPCVSSAIVSP